LSGEPHIGVLSTRSRPEVVSALRTVQVCRMDPTFDRRLNRQFREGTRRQPLRWPPPGTCKRSTPPPWPQPERYLAIAGTAERRTINPPCQQNAPACCSLCLRANAERYRRSLDGRILPNHQPPPRECRRLPGGLHRPMSRGMNVQRSPVFAMLLGVCSPVCEQLGEAAFSRRFDDPGDCGLPPR